MGSKKSRTVSSEKLQYYEAVVKTIPGLELKGATMPYTSHNGHMFSFLDSDENLGLRLPEDLRNDFLKRFNTSLCEAHGSVLKEYVRVPATLFSDTVKFKGYFKRSFDYVRTLKPK